MADPELATDDPSVTTAMPDAPDADSVSSSGTEEPPRTIGMDDAFHILQNSRRRAVLRYLREHPDREQFRMRDIAEEVAAWEHDTTVQQLVSDQRGRVYIALYQSHLPKLDDHGLIEYNQARGIVEPAPLIEVLAPYLEAGLHAETQELTLEGATSASEKEGPQRPGLVPGLSSLFAR